MPRSRSEWDLEPMGLSLSGPPGHPMVWQWKGGAMIGWPRWTKRAVIAAWNFLNCKIYGHEFFGPIHERGEVIIPKRCSNCGKRP